MNEVFDNPRDISKTVYELVKGISKGNGYLTDIGTKVYRGRQNTEDGAAPYLVVVEGSDNVLAANNSRRMSEVKMAQRYMLVACTPCDPDNPNDAGHDAVADIKRAIFGVPTLRERVKELAYKGKAIDPRPAGKDVVFATVELEVVYVEDLANP